MIRRLAPLFAIIFLAVPAAVQADPADIDAAARGVVRIVIVENTDGQLVPIGHGTGFAVAPEYIVTNAHVVEDARKDPSLSIGIVPSDGGEAVYGRLVSVSPRNDLALIATTKAMNLPPLTISGNPPADSGQVVSVGYPMNVDRAQGLKISDLFRSQPPVKATGALAGHRPTREFDTLLHTAPIARGNSGGPLLDPCGRVVGVNSFGAESGGADAEFYFAISTRELLPFLRANSITPQINSSPCRSFADLDADERARAEEEARKAQAQAQAAEEALAQRREEARRTIDFQILDERDNGMALALLLLLMAAGAGGFAWIRHEEDDRQQMKIAAGIAAFAFAGALAAWFSRPSFSEADDRLQDLLRAEMSAADTGAISTPALKPGKMICTLQPARSRITSTAEQSVEIDWTAEGCVNERTQYGMDAGSWTRVLVPNDEASVSVNRFDPANGEYRVQRYLLGHDEMAKVRQARSAYEAPACTGEADAARDLGAKQQSVLSLLPSQPNERLVYDCAPAKEEPAIAPASEDSNK